MEPSLPVSHPAATYSSGLFFRESLKPPAVGSIGIILILLIEKLRFGAILVPGFFTLQ